MLTRRFCRLRLSLAVLLAAGTLPWTGCGRSPRPNVLLIVLDTLRADRLSCYGYGRATSPFIDALAAEGAVFENTFSTCCWTLPSHASLFTGRHPLQAGATSETLHLPGENTTIAEALSASGYTTTAFVTNSWVSKERGFDQGFDEFFEMWRQENQPREKSPEQTLESVTVDKMISWLDEKAGADSPFFMFANLNGVHLPYQPREPFLSRFAGQGGYDVDRVRRAASITSWWAHLVGEFPLDETDYRIMSDLYDGEIGFADALVGSVIRKLTEKGILDNTIVIVLSDHGENLGEKGRIDHMMTMYDTALHIPLIVRFPPAFPPATRITSMTSIIDVAPTVATLCGVGDGFGPALAAPSLASSDRVAREYILAGNERPVSGIELLKNRYPGYDWASIDFRMRALRTVSHKLIWNENRDVELYNLNKDPGESENLAREQADKQRRLMGILQGRFKAIASSKEHPMLESEDEETLERLRSLGYIN